MKTRVLLTSPASGKTIEPLYDKPVFVRNAIASIAAYIREHCLVDMLCIDAKFEQITIDNLVSKIEDFKPDIVGISAFTYEIIDAGKLASKLKKQLPETTICIGGSHVSAIPEQTMEEFPEFDIGFIGESEQSFVEFINKTRGLSMINGIVYKHQGKIIKTNTRSKIDNLDILPMPAWDLLPSSKEYFIQTSRGCPFSCNFCFNPNGVKVRTKSIESIINEITWLIENKKPKRISFGDEAFGAKNDFAHSLLDKMIELKIGNKVLWDIQTHVSFITEELIIKLKQANVDKIELGVESGNLEILKNMGKGINKEKIIHAFTLCKKYKIKTCAFLVFGHPNETVQSIKESIDFVCKLNPTEPVFAIMVPFPGTKIADYVQNNEKGYIKTNASWDTYRKQINGAIRLENITNKTLKKYLIVANIKVFIYNFRIFDLLLFGLNNYKNILYFIIKFGK
ncbi:MAG TPA: radical SAM protein [Bacteroidales bacterium]|nr:radical SAM protein [Bacteroidales bacterium]